MPFNINSFKQNGLIWGGARPSLFEVLLAPPAGIGIETTTSAARLAFTCRAAELPEMTMSQIEIPYFGRKIKVAGERTFADWSITIMNDEDFIVRSMFEAWSNAMNRIVSNVRDIGISREQYKADLEVIQYSKEGAAIRSYILVGAFPTQIGAIDLDWDSTNTVETFAVNFAYDYWVPNATIEAANPKAAGVNLYSGLVNAGPQ